MAVLFYKKIWSFLIAGAFLLTGVFVVQAQSTKDPYLSEQWYLKAIHEPSQIPVGKTSIVAILDAGFDMKHEDLLGQYWTNSGELIGDHKDNDHNGYEEDVHGWDFVGNDPDPSPDISDPNANDTIVSHGTLLAGIIAAQANNGKGVAGIAPNAKIMPLRILDSQGHGTTSQVRDAITYAVKNGADVINLSLVSSKPDDQLQQVISWAVDQGVVVVAAVGNDNMDVDRDPTFPACFDTRIGVNRVIGVASLNQDGKKASFSNYGSDCVDIAAPGVNIFGAVYHDDLNALYPTAYGSPFEGTSISVPMVTGAVALLRSVYPTLTPEQIRLSIMLSADPILGETSVVRGRLGAGSLNIERALQVAVQFVGNTSNLDRLTSNQHPSGSLIVAQGAGSLPIVKRVSPDGKDLVSFFAFDKNFKGGVRVAAGDVNGDGSDEIITAPGVGGGPQIRVFDLSGKLVSQFFAFDPSSRFGLFVATGDVNGDGADEILTTQGQGGNGQVRLFKKGGEMIGSFYPFGRTSSPVSVTVGNFDDDPEMEIATSLAGADKSHRVKIFDSNGRYVRDFIALQSSKSGLRVSTVHIQHQKQDQILVSSDKNSSPMIGLYEASGVLINTSYILPKTFTGGVQIIAGVNKNGNPVFYSAPLAQGGPQVQVVDLDMIPVSNFFVFDKNARNGLSIAIWNP